jgi:uncharacterized membrane protein
MPGRIVLLALVALAGCHRQAPQPVDDTARDAAALPDPARVPAPPVATAPSVLPPKAGAVVPERIRAVGTEPFWSAWIRGTALTYSTPDFPAGIRITVARRDGSGGATFAGTIDGKPLMLEIKPGACSDGMSDRIYDFTAVREIGPDVARGCASR